RPAQAAAIEGDALDQHEHRCAWRQAQPIDRVAREPRQQCLAVAVDAKLDDRARWRANLADGAREHVECADVGWSRLCQYDVASAHAQTQAGTDAALQERQLPEAPPRGPLPQARTIIVAPAGGPRGGAGCGPGGP